MNKKIIIPIAILSTIVMVSFAFKSIIKSATKSNNTVTITSKKILNINEATVAIMNTNNKFTNLLVKGFYKSSTIKGDALIVTLANTIKDSGVIEILPCHFLNGDKPQLTDIPVNAEIVLTGNPLTLTNIPQLGECKLISINMPDLTAQF